MKKIIVSLILVMLVISYFCNITMAVDKMDVVNFYNGDDPDDDSPKVAVNILSGILAIVRTVGITTAVVILMTIGIKYMIASAGDRADIKKYAVKYIIGALILFTASGLVTIVQKVVDRSIVVE